MRKPKIFLIGDNHFHHCIINIYCQRPFKNIDEMNEILIRNWNKTVGKQDIVYVLGDFALCGKDKIIEVGKRLKGRKRLILGNHDEASLQTYREAGFEYIYNHEVFLSEYDCILSHKPLENCKYRNIHAHTHNKEVNDKNHFCVSVEKINYTPILLSEAINYFEELENG